ncbi:MAG: acyl-CoA reductase [Rikenellaceae bacterium]
MKNMVDIACTLASRLKDFGKTPESKRVIESAIELNPWFSHDEICMAVEAISNHMLNKERLDEWLSQYPSLPKHTAQRVGIIMAGNIPLVGFFDLLCTLMAGDEAWIKPSSKDRPLIEYICSTLKHIEPNIPIYDYNDSSQVDAVIATGGDDANRHFKQVFKSKRRLLRASRHSIAVLCTEPRREQLELLTKDIYTYSGLGCRNVAMIFSPKGYNVNIPAHTSNTKYKNNYLQSRALLTINKRDFTDNGSSIFIHSRELPHTLSAISIYEYDSLEEVEQWISEHEDELQCIASECIDHPRRVNFGQTQYPTLNDYADGVDTMKFLEFND